MQILIWLAISVASATALAFALPPPIPNYWPVAVALTIVGVTGLISSALWCKAWIRSLEIKIGGTEK